MDEEMLEIFSTEGEKVGTLEKKESHEKMRQEFFEKGSSSVRHKHIKLILLTSSGRIILQRRSKWKGDNAGRWDKTIGGHVSDGDTYDLTVLKECAEELGIPATVVEEDRFDHVVTVTNLDVLGVLKKLVFLDNHQSSRSGKDGQKWIETSKTQFYMGYYDGAIRFIDEESSGIQVFSLEELEKEIEEARDSFTDDVIYVINKFRDQMKPIENNKKHKLND